MRRIIGNKVYDTEEAVLLATCNYDGDLTDQLFRNPDGEYFLFGGLYKEIRVISFVVMEIWVKKYLGNDVYRDILISHRLYCPRTK
jgi:hypothetical protein